MTNTKNKTLAVWLALLSMGLLYSAAQAAHLH